MSLLNFSLSGCRNSKIINDLAEYVNFFAKHSLDSISLEIGDRHALSAYTSESERCSRAREACTNRKPKLRLGLRLVLSLSFIPGRGGQVTAPIHSR